MPRKRASTPKTPPPPIETPDITIDDLRKIVDEATPEQLKALENFGLAVAARELDTPEGFNAFFELMHGTSLHAEGKKWIENAYKAHEEGKGLLQKCHRESGKTTVFSKFFLAFRIGHEPEKVNVIIRINDDKANETTSAVANIIEHDPLWKMVFPNVVPDPKRWGALGYDVKRNDISEDEWARIKTKSPDGPTFVGYGWKSGSIIGSRFNGLVVVDDIHNEENTASERQLSAVKQFYTDTLSFCTMKGTWELWNYTPWVVNDTYAYAESTGRYIVSETPVMRPAEENDEGAQFWEPEADIPYSGRWWKLYWPEAWDFKRIADKYRIAGQIGFARMMLLDLEATKGINLKAEWLHSYPASEINPSWPVFFGIDYASTADKLKDKERDYFALAIVRAIPGGGLVLVDGYRGHISKGEALDLVISYWALYPTLQRIGVENIGKGEEFYNDLVLANDATGRVPPLMPITHGRRSKGERFEQWLGPRFQMSRIWIADRPTAFLNEFKNEWLLWPNAAHDDCLDGVYMAAVAGEGFMPTKAERTFAGMGERKQNVLAAFGRH